MNTAPNQQADETGTPKKDRTLSVRRSRAILYGITEGSGRNDFRRNDLIALDAMDNSHTGRRISPDTPENAVLARAKLAELVSLVRLAIQTLQSTGDSEALSSYALEVFRTDTHIEQALAVALTQQHLPKFLFPRVNELVEENPPFRSGDTPVIKEKLVSVARYEGPEAAAATKLKEDIYDFNTNTATNQNLEV